MEQMMGRLIAMIEQITAKVKTNTNAWREGNKGWLRSSGGLSRKGEG
jgi:hypothetical protein